MIIPAVAAPVAVLLPAVPAPYPTAVAPPQPNPLAASPPDGLVPVLDFEPPPVIFKSPPEPEPPF